MGTGLVIVPPPSFNLALGVIQRQEPMRIQAFLTQPPIEGLDLGIVSRSAGAREIQFDAVLVSPAIVLTSRFGWRSLADLFRLGR